MTKVALLAAVGTLGFLAVAHPPLTQAGDPAPVTTVVNTVTVVTQAPATYQSKPLSWWVHRAVANRREANQQHKDSLARGRTIGRLRRTLAHSPSVTEALDLERAVYGVDLTGRVRCESHFKPGAHNRSGASGLLQFLPSTWATTPFASLSVWSPYAAALAGGWMVRAGRSGEWACSL